jgi:peptide/nickel transport system substrate-binding protein
VLGAPKLDEVELWYIPDTNALSANLLAGTVDVTADVGPDLGLQLRSDWQDGRIMFNLGSGTWTAMFPQFIEPHPAILADVRMRRALAHAVDRQEIVDTIQAGNSPVAYSFLNPNQGEYREIAAAIPKYEYDPRRATALLQEIGLSKGSDGLYREAGGPAVPIEVRTVPVDALSRAGVAVASYWQRIGLDATAVQYPPQRGQDLEYVATFPAFFIRASRTDNLRGYHSSQTPLSSNAFRVTPPNFSRYMNPELDELLDTYYRTVPRAERTAVLGQIARHISEQVTVVGLWYVTAPGAISSRMLNVGPQWPGSLITWNAHEWDTRD